MIKNIYISSCLSHPSLHPENNRCECDTFEQLHIGWRPAVTGSILLFHKKQSTLPAVLRSNISSKFIFFCTCELCLLLRPHVLLGVCVLINDIGRRLPLEPQLCVACTRVNRVMLSGKRSINHCMETTLNPFLKGTPSDVCGMHQFTFCCCGNITLSTCYARVMKPPLALQCWCISYPGAGRDSCVCGRCFCNQLIFLRRMFRSKNCVHRRVRASAINL